MATGDRERRLRRDNEFDRSKAHDRRLPDPPGGAYVRHVVEYAHGVNGGREPERSHHLRPIR